MKITNELLISTLQQALSMAANDIQSFGKHLTVSHEFSSEHGATISNFSIIYTCLNTGIKFKLFDTMLWDNTNDIIINGAESYEIAEYENNKEFHHNERLYLDENGNWTQSSDHKVNSLLGDLTVIYRNKIKISDYLPNWKDMIVTKIKETHSLEVDE